MIGFLPARDAGGAEFGRAIQKLFYSDLKIPEQKLSVVVEYNQKKFFNIKHQADGEN